MTTGIIDIDALLDGNLADVEAAPDYVTPPTGTYTVSVTDVKMEKFDKRIYDEQRKDTGKTEPSARIRLTRALDSVIEYAEDDALPVNAGSLYSDTYMYNEQGLANFKRDAAAILRVDAAELNDYPLRDLFEALGQTEAVPCLIKTSTNREGFVNSRTTVLAEA